jgi:hypothetical protein
MNIIKSFRLTTSLASIFLLCFIVSCTDPTTPTPNNPDAPTIASFKASSTIITKGNSTVLSWTLSGPTATTVTIDNGVTVPTGSSSVSVSPSVTTTYTLTATNEKGSNSEKVTVTVTPPSVAVNKVGIVALATIAGTDFWSGVGSFTKAAGAFANPYEPLDLCAVATVDSTLPPNPTEPPDEKPVYLDAGDALSFKTNGTPYATFPKQVKDEVIGYAPTAPLTAPTGTVSFDIPGASGGFPAFSNVVMPSLASDLSFQPASGVITPDTRFTWTGSSGGAMVLFGGGQTPTGDPIFLFCNLKDDGEYMFSTDVKAKLADMMGGKLQAAYRINSRIETKGDASLVLLVYRTKVFYNF